MKLTILTLAALVLFGCATIITETKTVEVQKTWRDAYPPAHRGAVADDFHGTRIEDPYRWLEDPQSAETVAFYTAQNKLTEDYLAQTTVRDTLQKRLGALWSYARRGVPERHGERYYFLFNDGTQEQDVLVSAADPAGPVTVVLDPNSMSSEAKVALFAWTVSPQSHYMVYSISNTGGDEQELHIRDLTTGRDLPEVLQPVRFASIAWAPDESGFYYNRWGPPGTAVKNAGEALPGVYWHELATEQEADTLTLELPHLEGVSLYPQATDDGAYLLVWLYRGTDDRNGLYYREFAGGAWVELFQVSEARYSFVGNDSTRFYIHTDFAAPRGRVMSLDVTNQAQRNWQEVIPQQEHSLDRAYLIGSNLVTLQMRNASHNVGVYTLSGDHRYDIDLPAPGSVEDVWGTQSGDEMFFGFSSFTYPKTVFQHNLDTGETALVFQPDLDFDPAAFVTEQVWYSSKDGTQVSMFLTCRRDLDLTHPHPVLLNGYGGFNIAILPEFKVARIVWLEAGGIFAQANLRGGSEYGEEWHQAGMLQNKQNVFDDFIAAAEWLLANNYTTREKLAIHGRSNGGLLTAAVMVQRPGLFGAVWSQVPVIDMLRYHRFTVGRYWIPEYGDAETSPEQFAFMRAYSPLHNIQKGVAYPPLLVTTAAGDDRVVPAHSYKFIATLQYADLGANPLLLRVETSGGHGSGGSGWAVSRLVSEYADSYAFLFHQFGMQLR